MEEDEEYEEYSDFEGEALGGGEPSAQDYSGRGSSEDLPEDEDPPDDEDLADDDDVSDDEDYDDDELDQDTSAQEEPADLDELLGFNLMSFVGSAAAAGAGQEDENEDDSAEGADSCSLLPGELVIPGSRLADLFKVLEANRLVQEHVKGVMAKVERLIDRNWNDSTAISQQEPKTSRQAQEAAAYGSGPAARASSSRYWRVHGLAPHTDPEMAELAVRIRQLPPSFERARWSQPLSKLLQTGVLSEVQHLLTDRALALFQEQATAGSGGGSGKVVDLDAEFARIKEVDLESEAAQALVSEFGPEQWQRISVSFVKDRSADDCRTFYLHNLAPKRTWSVEESEKLRTLAEANAHRHWEDIATELDTGRTAAQCLQHFLKFSKPQHMQQRTLWTAQDDKQLRKMVEQFGTKWVRIAEEMGNRFDRHQLRDRWHGQTKRQHSRNVGRWGADEDTRLLQAAQDLGLKWTAIALEVRTRTPQQCRERYYNVLDPKLKLEAFSPTEETLLRSACEEQLKAHGRIIWGQVAKLFPGRTDELVRRAWRHVDKYGEVRIASASKLEAQSLRHSRRKLPSVREDQSPPAGPGLMSPSQVQGEAQEQGPWAPAEVHPQQTGAGSSRQEPTGAAHQGEGSGSLPWKSKHAPSPPYLEVTLGGKDTGRGSRKRQRR